MSTVHLDPCPLQAPLHPVKEEPALTAAVKVTEVPELYVAEQAIHHIGCPRGPS